MNEPVNQSGAPVLLHRVEGSVAWITLNRPQSINAFNMELRELLPAMLHELDRDSRVRVVILDGAGDRGFCSGADIKESRGRVTSLGEKDRLSPHSWIGLVAEVKKPIIVVTHGVCMGAGLELALACDLRIATKNARFAMPEIRIGLIPGGGGTQRLARFIGQGNAMDMVMSGEEIDGARAYQLGLVSRLLDTKEDALGEAGRIATAMAGRCGHALAFAKEAVSISMDGSLGSGLQMEKALFAILAGSAKERADRT
jgi:enoyl-CoA hydratase